MGNGITHLSVGTSLTQAEYESADAHVGGTGRSTTYVIAASDAPAQVQSQADYVMPLSTSDLGAVVNAAYATYKDIFLTEGNYAQTTAIGIPAKGVIRGAGSNTTITLANGFNANSAFYNLSGYGGGDTDIRIKNFTVDGNSAGVTANDRIFFMDGVSNISISDVEITDQKGRGIVIYRSTYADISENYIHDGGSGVGDHGIHIDASSYSSVLKNKISNVTGRGIQIHADAAGDSRYNIVSSNIIQIGASSSVGINAQRDANFLGNNVISNNVVQGNANGYEHYQILDGADNVVSNNVSVDAGENGIIVQGARNIVSENNIINARDNGLQLIGSNNVVSNNIVTSSDNGETGCSGISLEGAGGSNLVVGNLVSDPEGSPTQDYGIRETAPQDSNTIEANDVRDNVIAGILTVGASTKVFGNSGYIAPCEVRTYSGSLTAGNANAITFAWHNPESQDILISKVVLGITTPGGTALSVIQVGIADDATGTNLGSEFFTGIDANSSAVNDSYLAGDTGAQTKWVFCQDSVSATDGWVVGKILTQNAASLAGSYYIEYVGK